MLRFASFVGLAGILACGARTPLDDLQRPAVGGSGEGGSGAAPEGAGGEGAAGNAPPLACAGLEVDGLPLTDSGLLSASQHESSPRLVPVDDQRVMLFHTVLDDNAEAATIRAATFDAWGTWPESLGPPNFLTGSVRSGALMARGFAGDAALLLPLFSLGAPGAVTPAIATSVAPATPYMEIPYEYLFELPTMPGSGGSFATSKEGTALIGWRIDAEGTSFLGHVVTDASGEVLDGPYFESGCALGTLVADATAVEGGYLAAFSSGRGLDECLNDDGIPGPPTRLQVLWWRDGVGMVSQWEEPLSEPLASIAVVPREGGAWLIYQTDGSTSLTFPPVMGLPLGPEGLPAGDPVTLVEDGRTFPPFAAARFGSGLALAFIDALDPSAPTVIVRLFDAAGALLTEGSFNTAPAFLLPDNLSLVASPDADALLVAWTSADAELRSVAARFACVQAL